MGMIIEKFYGNSVFLIGALFEYILTGFLRYNSENVTENYNDIIVIILENFYNKSTVRLELDTSDHTGIASDQQDTPGPRLHHLAREAKVENDFLRQYMLFQI